MLTFFFAAILDEMKRSEKRIRRKERELRKEGMRVIQKKKFSLCLREALTEHRGQKLLCIDKKYTKLGVKL